MQVSKHVHSVRIPFRLQIGPGVVLERFVYVHLIYGKQIYMMDSGVAGCKDTVFDYIRKTGRDPGEIAAIIFTHSHPDHIGAAREIYRATGCRTAAHAHERTWIEDVELQCRERPVPGFHSIVEGSVKVAISLKDGDTFEVGGGSDLKVIHTPGHSKGHISLLYRDEGVLICGDSVPLPGEMPIYEDVLSSMKSLEKLRGIGGLEVLLSSWDEPRYGVQAYEALNGAIHYIQNMHAEVLKAKATLHSSDPILIAKKVCESMCFPATALNPLFLKTLEAHLKTDSGPELNG